MNDDDRSELNELRAMRARHRMIRREASEFVQLINNCRSVQRSISAPPTIKYLRREWRIIISALQYCTTHGVLHEDISSLLATTLVAILDGRLPEEFHRANVRPKNDYARPEWRAAAKIYASASRVDLIDDAHYKATLESIFNITRPTLKRWLGSSEEQRFDDLLFTETLEVYRQSTAILRGTQERSDQATEGVGVVRQQDRSFPAGMSPDEIREKLKAAAKAYNLRRMNKK